MVTPSGDFLFRHPVEVRFRDIDAGGHAHHSLALIYFEEARSAYWEEVVGRSGLDEVDYIMAEATVRYHRRIFWPGRLSVGVRVSRIGRKHFVMEYAVEADRNGEILVSGSTVQVMYDYEEGASKSVSDELRARIEEWEGSSGP